MTNPEDATPQLTKLWELSMSYKDNLRLRALLSLFSALTISIVGIIFFFYALRLMMSDRFPFSILIIIAAMLIQVVSAIGFSLYVKATNEIFTLHLCLERTYRYLLANSICNSLEEQGSRDAARSKLIHLIASAPPLSVSEVEVSDISQKERQGETTSPRPPEGSSAQQKIEASSQTPTHVQRAH